MQTIEELKRVIESNKLTLDLHKSNILKDYSSLEDKIIASIALLPSQSYGCFIKSLVLDNLEDIDEDSIRVCVAKTDRVVLKQIKPNLEVKNYICVVYSLLEKEVSIYSIPWLEVISNLKDKPDHGSLNKNSGEFSSQFKFDDLKRFKIES